MRYGDDEYTRWAGHLGYGVRPSERRRGHATWAVGHILRTARRLGMRRVLAVCAPDNVASIATIERNGGAFEAVQDTPFGAARRYGIDVP